MPRVAKVLLALAGGAILAWWARGAAHSEVPPPEGRWRELREDELG